MQVRADTVNGPPRPLSPDEVELLKKYRDLLMPATRLAGYDEFAKWLFTVTAVIGTLGAAFSNTALKNLSGTGAAVFFLAVLSTGVSLALAVFQRGIETPDANWQSLPDMLAKAESALRIKRGLVWASGTFFALAILLAGLAPLLAQNHSPTRTLTFSYGKDGVHVAGNLVQHQKATGELEVSVLVSGHQALLAAQRVVADARGGMTFDVSSGAIPTGTTGITINVTCDLTKNLKQSVVISLQPQPDRTLSNVTPSNQCFD
jgi:hypothetical protein